MSEEKAKATVNEVLVHLEAILRAADNVFIAHGRKVLPLSSMELPPKKVVNFIKTQLDECLGEMGGEEETEG